MTGARSLRMLGVRTTLYGRTALLQAAPAEVRAAELASFLHLAPGVPPPLGRQTQQRMGSDARAELIGKCGHRRGRIASQEIVTATLFDGKATLLVTGIACGAEHPSGQRTHGPRQHHHHPEIPTHAAQRRRRRRHRPGQHPQTQRHLTPHDEAARRVRRTPHTPPLARERDRLAAHRSRSRNLTQTGHLTRPTPMQTPSSKPQADPSSPTSALHPREVAIFAETRASRTGAEPARVCSHRFRPSVPR
jgi:hypothetical protein